MAKKTTRPKRLKAFDIQTILNSNSVKRVEPRPMTAGASAKAVAGATPTFVAMVSHTGPWELRALIVNDLQILEKSIATSSLRIEVPIPAVLKPPLHINWSILAGHLIPSVAIFVVPPGPPPHSALKPLATKQPLKKGESWAPLKPIVFPPR